MNTTKQYLPVPVSEARSIAIEYDKSVVIICAWSNVHGLLHTTTYGVTPEDKIHAASGGEACAKALGMDMTKKDFTEDFRKDGDAAKQRAMQEAIEKHLPALKKMAEQILSPNDNTFSRMVNDFEKAL